MSLTLSLTALLQLGDLLASFHATSPVWKQLCSSFIKLPACKTALAQERPGLIAHFFWPMINKFLVCLNQRQEVGASLCVDLVS